MSEPSPCMPVYIERGGDPATRQIVMVALDFNLAGVRENGWTFPRLEGRQDVFGNVRVEREGSRFAVDLPGWLHVR